MSQYEDRLKDYVDVKERIRLFYEAHPEGRLTTEDIVTTNEPDGVPRVMVRAAAYRTPDDPIPGRGSSWLSLPGTTNFTRGSELENTETSAWGRAIGALGIGIDKSIASANEIANKEPQTAGELNAQERERLAAKEHRRDVVDTHPDHGEGLIGTAIAQGTQDFELRQGPDGFTLPFRVKNGTKSFIVLAEGKLAEALSVIRPTVEGARVTVWGHWTDETLPATSTRKAITYRVLHLERIETPDGMLPPEGPIIAGQNDEEPVEAETAALFTGPEFEKPDAAA